MAKGLDASVNCAQFVACIKSWGATFVARYYTSGTGAKLLRLAEAKALSNAGLGIVVVYQVRQNRVDDFSFAKGRTAATTAISRAREVGQPDNSAIYFAVDYDTTAAQVSAGGPVAEYFRGIHAVWAEQAAQWKIGVYGSGRTCKAMLDVGHATLTWLAQSTGFAGFAEFRPSATIVQGPVTKICANKLEIDSDEAQAVEFGAFRLGTALPVSPLEAAPTAPISRLWTVNPPTAAFPGPGPSGQVVLAMPHPIDLERPIETIVFFHGWGTDIAQKVEAHYAIVSQVTESGRNAVVVAPQLRYRANSGDPGRLAGTGALRALLDSVAPSFEEKAAQPGLAAKLKTGPVVLCSFSGGYVALAAGLAVGGVGTRVIGTALFDSAYGEFGKIATGFAAAASASGQRAIFASWHGQSTLNNRELLKAALGARGIRVAMTSPLPLPLIPGSAYLLNASSTPHERVPPDGPPRHPLATFLRALPDSASTPAIEPEVTPEVVNVPPGSAFSIGPNHRLSGPGVSARISPHHKAGLRVRYIVLHYTAGGSATDSVKALENVGLSAHVVVDRDGTITQTVPFDRIAYHAGESEWEGYSMLNGYAIGIEIANYGWLTPRPDGSYQRVNAHGNPETPRFEASQVLVADHRNGWPKAYGWELYPPEQLASVRALCQTLLERYSEIVDIVGHDEISPARKQDPGPALDIAPFRHLVEARNVDKGLRYEVASRDGANLRTGPGTEFDVIRLLPDGMRLFGKSLSGVWRTVDLEGDDRIDGFVHNSLLRKIS